MNARRLVLAAFGGITKHKEASRDGRGLAWLGGFSLDLRLAIRMLARYPWLTLVGSAAMAFGVAAAVGTFELRTQFVDPSLPLDQGSRIVGFRNWDAARNRPVLASATDFSTWREALTSIEDLSAVSVFPRNLITADGQSEAVDVAAMSASGFRMARVLPLLGRTLVEADEDPGAPSVVIIGHDVWERRFAGDPGIVGQTIRLGDERRTVAGVMPEGFAFPAAHNIWIPLRLRAGAGPGEGPGLQVFGRLGRGASRTQAQAELLAISQRTAPDVSGTREHLRPQLVPYAWLFFDPSNFQRGLVLGNIFVVMLLVLVCANVALLTFARAATRETEIAVRSALGASRARIVGQLFVEGFVLASLAVVVGLVAARLGVRSLLETLEADSGQTLPFWMGDLLTPTTLIYAGALTILSAAVVSVLPALKITSRGLSARLRQSTAGGGGFRFGGIWTAVIVSQVAATLTFPAAALFFHRVVVEGQTRDLGFPAGTYLSARLQFDRDSAPGVPIDTTDQAFGSRLRGTYAELERRVTAEPDVTGLMFADRLPGTLHPRWWIESDGEEAPTTAGRGHPVSSASVALNFFDVVGAPVLAGRAFTAADVESVPGPVIVNQSLVTQVFGGRNPIGRRIRRVRVDDTQQAGPWLEIVGMVRDLGMLEEPAGLYRPIMLDRVPVLRIAIGVRNNPESFAARLRSIASEVEPRLQIRDLVRLDEAGANGWLESQYLSRVLAVLSAIALLLSLTAVYAVVSFTVSRRTREIGIRVALGADRRRVIGTILRRPLGQVGLGSLVGGVLVAITFVELFESTPTAEETASIAAYAVLMTGVCLLACIVPAQRALRVEPASALRVER